MFKIALALHLVFAVFAIGPLVHAATTAGRGVRQSDAPATRSSARMMRIYAYASVLVVVAGFAVMSSKSSYTHKTTAQFSDTYIWLSTVLWILAVAVVLFLLVPGLDRAATNIEADQPAAAFTARIAAGGGVVALIFGAIIFLMVYRPGG